MARKHFVTAIIFGLTGVLTFACSEPDWAGGKLEESKDGNEPAAGGDDDDDKAGGGAEPSECVDTSTAPKATGDETPGLDVDKSTLATCCEEEPGQKAHCVPDDKLKTPDRLNTCKSGGRCVPDSIIDGQTPKPCKVSPLDGAPGACVSNCIKSVAAYKGVLKADGCTGGLVCAPCERNGEKTGACEVSTSKKSGGGGSSPAQPKKDCTKKPAPAPESPAGDSGASGGGGGGGGGGAGVEEPTSCCGDKGLCATKEQVETRMPGKSGQLEAKECKNAKLCAPKENADPAFKPKACKGTALTGPYTGVCLSNCIAFSTSQKLASSQGDCDSDHRCLPCKLLGILATGAPGCE